VARCRVKNIVRFSSHVYRFFGLVHACIFSQATGERVDPTQYYFRAVPRYETGAKDYEWLNGMIAIATGDRGAREVIITVYEVA
jgi:hypothetical protein